MTDAGLTDADAAVDPQVLEPLVFDPLEVLLPELARYVAIPSVSRSATAETMHEAAEYLASMLSFAGGRVVETDGFPVVRAEWTGAPGAPTVLVYGHYDVQPTGSRDEWLTDPFELVLDESGAEDVLRGRGVTDDKGPVFLVVKLAQAFIEQRGALPLNVLFLLEGEEEIGSPSLPAYVRAHADELACDLVISADGAQWRVSEPSVSVASKGLVSLDIEVRGANTDLHSGRFGGTVANPVHALSTILASLHDADGAVAVAGFYDGVQIPDAARRESIAAVPFDDDAYRQGLGVDELFGEAGFTTLERLWERPTLEITGVTAGGKYSVIPHVATAHIASRLVGEQDPDAVARAIEEHVRGIRSSGAMGGASGGATGGATGSAIGGAIGGGATGNAIGGVTVEVRVDAARVPAYRIEPDHPAIRAATAALGEVYPGDEVLLAVIAGTLPAATLFEDVLGVKTLFFSFSIADENLHAPNEFMRTRRLFEGMRAWEQLWQLLAAGEHRLEPNPRHALSTGEAT